MTVEQKPVVLITGAAGKLGSALTEALADSYRVVKCDLPGKPCDIVLDITSDASLQLAIEKIGQNYGKRIAAVVHLAAYFDFSGEHSPLYDKVNVEGTRNLLKALQVLQVERFIYSGTMLVHKAGKPGEQINEERELDPQWAYPQSKARSEAMIEEHHGQIPVAILHLAGLYDEQSMVPTLAQQVARIYERNLKSLLYSGDKKAGQAFIHQADMVDLFRKTIEHRNDLPEYITMLAGEPDVMSYQELQETLGRLIHGEKEWKTLIVPKPVAKVGAWLEEEMEPLVPDDFDRGERPFIRPFMIDMASDHYELDISLAEKLLDWHPKYRLRQVLPSIIAGLKKDPLKWYEENQVTPPDWMLAAGEKHRNPEKLRRRHVREYERQHNANLWAPFMVVGLGFWLLTAPPALGYESQGMIISDLVCGFLVICLGLISLSPRPPFPIARGLLGVIGIWLLAAPLVFWAPTAAAYLNDTLVGALIIGLALLVRPFPGISPVADTTGPAIPPGWNFSPSDWFQRVPIIVLAFVGFYISRYLTAYQLEHINGVWEPFFTTGADPGSGKNGTEEIITSSVSQAWPVPDAGLGALTYMLEILTGMMGSRNRWRTMPWLVLLFGLMIVPLGAVSITFIIIQPLVLDTWCTLCLIAAAAMLLQIPYSFDEIVATFEFLRRKAKAGRPWLRILFTGDTDEGEPGQEDADNFRRKPFIVVKDMLLGGISVSWNLLACAAIGIWLMCTRLVLGTEGGMADADHLIGSLVLTITVTAWAEVMRPIRFLNMLFGLALLITPFVLGAGLLATISSVACGIGLMAFSVPRGTIHGSYGRWDRFIF